MFQLGRIGALFGGISPPKPPRGDGTGRNPSSSGVTDGGKGCAPPHGKLNIKNGPPC